jgi:hypothetical protein
MKLLLLVILSLFALMSVSSARSGSLDDDYGEYETRRKPPRGGLISRVVSQALGLSSSSNNGTRRRFYGEPCDKTFLLCDRNAWLNCLDGKCACMQPQEMLYSSDQGKCVSKAGERCKFEIGLILTADCVENAVCKGSNGTCTCGWNYFENVNGTCSPKGAYREACSLDAECMDDERIETYLSCIEGTCTCGPTEIYHEETGTCMGMAGRKSDTDRAQRCLPPAIWDMNGNGVCACLPESEYFQGRDGRCHSRHIHGENCTDSSQCKFNGAYLKCISDICTCDEKTHMYREFRDDRIGRKQCVGLAGQPCNLDGECVQDAACDFVQNICLCDSGYSKNSKVWHNFRFLELYEVYI